MPIIKINPKDLPKELRARFKSHPEVVTRGLNTAAMRAQALLVQRTPVNTGRLKASWRVRRGTPKVPPEVENVAPHAGVVEEGARPHRVNEAGIRALTRWAQLKLGLSREEAEKAANRIAWKLRRHGQEPTYFVRDSMDELRRAMVQEVERSIEREAKKRASLLGRGGLL